MSEAREKLKQAVASVSEITLQIEQLEAAAASSERIFENAEAQLAAFKDLDRSVTKFRADTVKRGLGTQTLPDSLKAKLTARRDAAEEVEQALATGEAINDELKAVRETLEPAKEAARFAAVAVLREISDSAATELIAINARQWELEWILQGLEYLKFQNSIGMIRLGKTRLMEQASVRFSPQFTGIFDPVAGMVSRWKDRLELLLGDPDAILSLPKPVMPEDFVRRADGEYVRGEA